MAREITTTEELETRVAEGKVVVLKCFTTKCFRCPAVGDLLTLLQSTHKFEIAPCNMHTIEEELYEVLQVTRLPALLIFKNRVEVGRADGIWESDEIKSLINNYCEVQLSFDEDF